MSKKNPEGRPVINQATAEIYFTDGSVRPIKDSDRRWLARIWQIIVFPATLLKPPEHQNRNEED